MVPEPVIPQAFESKHVAPVFATQQRLSEGATAEHEPLHCMVPDPDMPHEFDAEHELPVPAAQYEHEPSSTLADAL